MVSNRLPVGFISSKQASQSYTCCEKYEWHNLAFNQSEQATRGQAHHVATIRCSQHMARRMGRYITSHDRGHSFEICGSGNVVDGPVHTSSTCVPQDHTCLSRSSERARHSISPEPDPKKAYWSKRCPSFGCVQRGEAVSCRNSFSVNQPTGCQNRYYHEDRCSPTKNGFSSGPFSKKDVATHRTYMQSFRAYNNHDNRYQKDPISNIFDRIPHGQRCRRDEVVTDNCKRPFHEFPAVQDEQLELPPNEDSECSRTNRNFRNSYNSNVIERKCLKQVAQKSTYNGASASKYGTNSSLKRNADHLDGKKARTNMVYEDKSKKLCCPDGKDQQLQVESEDMRNDIVKGNVEGPNGAKAKGNCYPESNALTLDASSGSRKWDENSNMLSPKCNSKAIASLNTSELSEGSKSMDLESDKESTAEGCAKRGMVHNLSVDHSEKSVQSKGFVNLAISPKHEILKVNGSELPNHISGSTAFNGSELVRGAIDKCQKRHVQSCECYCKNFKNRLYVSGSIDIEPETMNSNIISKKQEHSALANSENNINQKATKDDSHALHTLGVSSYQSLSQHDTLDITNYGALIQKDDDGIPCPSIPDLNILPIMDAEEGSVPSEEHVYEADESFFPSEGLECHVHEGSLQPSEELFCQVDEGSLPFRELVCQVDECSAPSEVVCQVPTYGSKPLFVTKSLLNSTIAPAIKEEQFKQAERTQFVGEICDKGTSESPMQISDSNTGPPQFSTAAESSIMTDAFKIALCEFIKDILKPLYEDGLLTREVHKIIVKKASEKVTGAWGSRAPSTELAISRVLSDESQSLHKLIQEYLEVYVGKGVLKKCA